MFEGTGVGSLAVFWIFRLLLLGVLIYAGRGISYDKPAKFKKYAWIAGVSYSLIQGLRWMRGADYCHYYNDIVSGLGSDMSVLYGKRVVTPDPEPIYELFINTTYNLGIPFWIIFVFYSALLIGAVLLICKTLPKTAVWALPMFFIITVSSSENIIRQYIAEAVILYAYYYYINKDMVRMGVALVIAPLIHYSSLIAIGPFLFIILSVRKLTKVYNSNLLLGVLVILYIYMYWFFDISTFQAVSNFISDHFEANDSKPSNFISDPDRWFSAEGSISMVLYGAKGGGISLANNIVKFISYLLIIVLGFAAKKDDSRLILAYGFTYLAIIIKVCAGDIEIYARFYNWFVILMPFVIGAMMVRNKMKIEVKYLVTAILILFFGWYTFFASITGAALFGYGFIWDADVPLF